MSVLQLAERAACISTSVEGIVSPSSARTTTAVLSVLVVRWIRDGRPGSSDAIHLARSAI
jgi:hypothetical protein